MKNLLLDNSGEVVWRSFRDLETNEKGAWRWGYGANSKIFFPGDGDGRISYRIFLPHKNLAVNIYCNGDHTVRLIASNDSETLNGFFEIPRVTFPVQVTLEFRVEKSESCDPSDQTGKSQLTFAIFDLAYSHHACFSEEENAHIEALKTSREISKTLCALPFQELYINAMGFIEPCCHSSLNVTPFQRPVQDGETLRTEWNNSSQRGLRKEMILGRRPEACSSCYQMEDAGAKSLRQYATSGREDSLRGSVKSMGIDGSMPFPPDGVDIRLGNTCNLKCRICYPHHSQNLINEFSDYYGRNYSFLKKNRWLTKPLLIAVANTLKIGGQLHVAGGEPFITPEFIFLMEECVRTKVAGSLSLRIITNLTHFRDDVKNLLKKFGDVRLTISLDGCGEVNDYIRHPSRFEQIDRNLRHLSENMNKYNITSVRFNTTVQAMNIFFLPELFIYLERFPMFDWFPNLSPIIEPEHLSVWILPPKAKERAKSVLEAYISQTEAVNNSRVITKYRKKIKGDVTSLINYIFLKNKEQLLCEFHRFNKFLDDRRNQRPPPALQDVLNDIFPIP